MTKDRSFEEAFSAIGATRQILAAIARKPALLAAADIRALQLDPVWLEHVVRLAVNVRELFTANPNPKADIDWDQVAVDGYDPEWERRLREALAAKKA